MNGYQYKLMTCDDGGLIWPIISKAHPRNGHDLIIKCNSDAGIHYILACFWHSSHDLAYSMQSLIMAGQ